MDYKDHKEQKEQVDVHFWYKARKALLVFLLEKTFGKNQLDKKLIDIGCGTGDEIEEMKKYGQVTAIDINQDALDVLAKDHDCQTILGDIQRYDLGENIYDGACCFDILEHLEKDQLAMDKIYKSLKPGAKLIFTVPAYQFLYGPHDMALEHKRRYNKKETKQKLVESGFEIEKIAYWNSILFPLQLVFRIVKNSYYKIFKIKKNTPETSISFSLMDKVFYFLMHQDLTLIKRGLSLPFGLTIYGIARKK